MSAGRLCHRRATPPNGRCSASNAPARITAHRDRRRQVARHGRRAVVQARRSPATTLRSTSSTRRRKREQPDGALPDGQVATGTHDIARAWLAEPTDRYDHGILGDKIEAGALVIETRDGKRHERAAQGRRGVRGSRAAHRRPRRRRPRRDRRGEILSQARLGAGRHRRAQAAATRSSPRRRRSARPHRWLDPAGIAEFTGDGKTDIALVRQPHVDRHARIVELARRRLAQERPNCPTPPITSPARAQIDMAAVADFDGDGIADIAHSLARPRALAHRQFRAAPARDRQRAAAGQGGDQSRD